MDSNKNENHIFGFVDVIEKQAQSYLKWYHKLPTISRSIGILDSYNQGTVRHIDFYGDCTVVWIEYSTKTKAYSYK